MPVYKSCHSIENGLSFLDNKILYCTLINAYNGLGLPVIKDNYSGELIDWKAFFELRNQHRKLFQNGGFLKECENCNCLQEEDWSQKDEINYVLLSTWKKCNSFCTYCCTEHPGCDLKEEDELPSLENGCGEDFAYDMRPVLKDMIEKNILAKDAIIDFAGGEPTMYEYFGDLLNLFLDKDYKNIIVHTNSILYSPEIARGIEHGAVNILCSIDAGSKEIHQKVKRVKSYDKVWSNLEKYFSYRKNDSKQQLRTKYIVVPGLNDRKEEVYLWLVKSKEIGATGVVLNLDNNFLAKYQPNIEYYKKLVELTEYFISKAKELEIPWTFYPNIRHIYNVIDSN